MFALIVNVYLLYINKQTETFFNLNQLTLWQSKLKSQSLKS